MGFALGRAPLPDGTGTSPEDMQRIIGSAYMNEGIVPGPFTGKVEGTTSMAYEVEACTSFMYVDSSAKLGYLVPTEATTVVTDPAPSTGSRIDTVYVDLSGAVRVSKGGSIPPGVRLGRFVVPAGATSTQSIANTQNRSYAVPAGGNLGRMSWYRHPSGGVGAIEEQTLFSDRIYVPTDRVLHVDMTATIATDIQDDNNAEGIANFTAEFVGGSSRTMMCHHAYDWNTFSGSWSFIATEGELEFNFKTRSYRGDNWKYAFSPDVVTEVTVRDGGVSR